MLEVLFEQHTDMHGTIPVQGTLVRGNLYTGFPTYMCDVKAGTKNLKYLMMTTSADAIVNGFI